MSTVSCRFCGAPDGLLTHVTYPRHNPSAAHKLFCVETSGWYVCGDNECIKQMESLRKGVILRGSEVKKLYERLHASFLTRPNFIKYKCKDRDRFYKVKYLSALSSHGDGPVLKVELHEALHGISETKVMVPLHDFLKWNTEVWDVSYEALSVKTKEALTRVPRLVKHGRMIPCASCVFCRNKEGVHRIPLETLPANAECMTTFHFWDVCHSRLCNELRFCSETRFCWRVCKEGANRLERLFGISDSLCVALQGDKDDQPRLECGWSLYRGSPYLSERYGITLLNVISADNKRITTVSLKKLSFWQKAPKTIFRVMDGKAVEKASKEQLVSLVKDVNQYLVPLVDIKSLLRGQVPDALKTDGDPVSDTEDDNEEEADLPAGHPVLERTDQDWPKADQEFEFFHEIDEGGDDEEEEKTKERKEEEEEEEEEDELCTPPRKKYPVRFNPPAIKRKPSTDQEEEAFTAKSKFRAPNNAKGAASSSSSQHHVGIKKRRLELSPDIVGVVGFNEDDSDDMHLLT